MKFTQKDFEYIWDHSEATYISPSLAKRIAAHANKVLKKRTRSKPRS